MYRIHFLLIIFFTSTISAQDNQKKNIDYLTQRSYQHLYSNKDSAYFYLSKASNLIDSTNLESGIITLTAWSRSASYFYDLERMRLNIKTIDSIYAKYEKQLNQLPFAFLNKNGVLFDKGIYNFEVGNLTTSRDFFDKVIDAVEQIPDSLKNRDHVGLLTSAYGFMGKIYNNEHKYNLAKAFYNKTIRLLTAKAPENKQKLYRYYSLLAEVYKNEGEFDKSNKLFIQSLLYNINETGSINNITVEAFHVVDNYINLSQLDSADYYLELMKSNIPDDHPMVNRYHEAKALVFEKNSEYAKAVNQYNLALEVIGKRANGANLERIAILHNKMGQLHATFNEPQKAIESFNLAIAQLSKKNANKSELLKVLKNKAVVISAYDTESSNIEVLKTVDFGIGTLDSLRPTFKSEADKLLLVDNAYPLFESGLAHVYDIYNTSNDKKYIDKAFFYSEKSKSILLMEALLSSKASNFASIPNELLEKEKQLKAKITYLEKKINTGKSTVVIEDELFAVKKEYRNLIATIETDYKDYYNLKYNTEVLPLQSVQKLLSQDEALVSYFYGYRNIYIITVTNNSKDIRQVKINTDLGPQIRNVYQMLSDPKSDITELATQTYKLYSNILEPSIATLNKDKLIIIADGLLNYIPFSSLNTIENGINYLVEQKSIAYANSATLLDQLRARTSYKNTVLAFAPSFGLDNKELLPLPNNTKEVERILTSFNGNSYLDEKATLSNFTNQISDFGLVHLATHAIFDDENPAFSYLAFTPTDDSDYLLYVSDLYNIKLDANLVTLSACESGIGELKHGEGFMSLARGFFYSGASSISSTLWKINDASTTQLMDGFYRNLAKGNSKDKALQKAQLDFIKTNKENALVHPYYWSGFVVSGNTNAVVDSKFWVWIVFGALLVAFLGLYFLRKRNKSVS